MLIALNADLMQRHLKYTIGWSDISGSTVTAYVKDKLFTYGVYAWYEYKQVQQYNPSNPWSVINMIYM